MPDCCSLILWQLQQDIQVRSNEAQRESRKKDKLERELRQGKAELDNKASEIRTLQGQIDRYKQDIAKTEQQLKEQRVSGMHQHLLGWGFRILTLFLSVNPWKLGRLGNYFCSHIVNRYCSIWRLCKTPIPHFSAWVFWQQIVGTYTQMQGKLEKLLCEEVKNFKSEWKYFHSNTW